MSFTLHCTCDRVPSSLFLIIRIQSISNDPDRSRVISSPVDCSYWWESCDVWDRAAYLYCISEWYICAAGWMAHLCGPLAYCIYMTQLYSAFVLHTIITYLYGKRVQRTLEEGYQGLSRQCNSKPLRVQLPRPGSPSQHCFCSPGAFIGRGLAANVDLNGIAWMCRANPWPANLPKMQP